MQPSVVSVQAARSSLRAGLISATELPVEIYNPTTRRYFGSSSILHLRSETFFKQFSRLIILSGVTTLGIIALDGTKMGCNASLSANPTAKWLSQQLSHAMIDEFDRGLQQDDHEKKEDLSRFPEYRLPDELATREKRLEHLKAAYTIHLEEQNEEARLKEQDIANREAEKHESGKEREGGRQIHPPVTQRPTRK